jgi:hypothetical protein
MTMGILNIAPAERAGAHLLIQLYGPPRSGKTYTALRIARGMVGPKGKIGVLDTESGRARLYSDKVPGGFVVGELTPPYAPRRYLEARSSSPTASTSSSSTPSRIAGRARAASWRWPTRPRSMAGRG